MGVIGSPFWTSEVGDLGPAARLTAFLAMNIAEGKRDTTANTISHDCNNQ